MKDRPIIFSVPMVRAILDGRKTQTRRIVKPQPCFVGAFEYWHEVPMLSPEHIVRRCPYGVPGDRLWVREQLRGDGQPGNRRVGITRYGADGDMVLPHCCCGAVICKCGENAIRADHIWNWKNAALPSIHMPRWASRITLEVTGVRVERLQDISENDAKAEGVTDEFASETWMQSMGGALCGRQYRYGFQIVWDSINSKRAPWESNPWVWCISFRRTA